VYDKVWYGTMINQKDRGGRPSHKVIKHLIPYIVKELGMANAAMIRRKYELDTGRNTSKPTIKKYAEILADEGILKREVIVDNSNSKKRRYLLIMYSLN
jgi:hypothetical protein